MSVANFDNKEDYKMIVNKSKYLLFKSRDHFNKIEELDIMVDDLVRVALWGEEDKNEIILYHMELIEKYLKTINITEVKVLDKNYDPFGGEPEHDDCDDAFEIMFSTLSLYFIDINIAPPVYSDYGLFLRKLKTKEMKKRYKDLRKLISKIIIKKYK